MRCRWVLAGAVVAALAAGGVVLTRGAPDVLVPNPTERQLDGHFYVATEIVGYEPVIGTELRLSFDAGMFSAGGGCNDTDGSFSVRGGRIGFGDDVTRTLKACAGGLEQQDDWFSDFVDGADVGMRGDGLAMQHRGVSIRFEPVLDRDAPGALVGGWMLTTVRGVDGVRHAVRTAPVRDRTVLEVSDRSGWFANGCGSTALTLAVGEREVAVRRRRSSAGSHTCSPRARATLAMVRAVVRGSVAAHVTGRRLTLRHGGAELGFVAPRPR